MQHPEATLANGSHGQLRLVRDAELANHDHLEWGLESGRNLGGNRYATVVGGRARRDSGLSSGGRSASCRPASTRSVNAGATPGS